MVTEEEMGVLWDGRDDPGDRVWTALVTDDGRPVSQCAEYDPTYHTCHFPLLICMLSAGWSASATMDTDYHCLLAYCNKSENHRQFTL